MIKCAGVQANLPFRTDFWGPASNFGIPLAAVMDVKKDPEMWVLLLFYPGEIIPLKNPVIRRIYNSSPIIRAHLALIFISLSNSSTANNSCSL